MSLSLTASFQNSLKTHKLHKIAYKMSKTKMSAGVGVAEKGGVRIGGSAMAGIDAPGRSDRSEFETFLNWIKPA